MIKIEKIQAQNATIIRGGVRQPLVLHSHISPSELTTIEAEGGIITYSVNELEVKQLTFEAKPVEVKPAVKQPAPRVTQPAAKASKQAAE